MMYTHTSIHVNNRIISIDDICQQNVKPLSENERAAFDFIRSWLQGQHDFQLQTSGSTGQPKKITVTRQQLQASATATLQALQIPSFATSLICLNTTFIAGVMMLVRSLMNNLSMIIVDPVANPLASIRVDMPIHLAALVPYQAEAILQEYGVTGINRIEKVIIGGAPLPGSTKEQLLKSESEVYLTYGMTETLSHIALQRISGKSHTDYFTVLPTISIRKDERGCLAITVPYLTQEVVTNDLVDILSPTTFRWLGRYDNVINSGGIKIIPEIVEASLEEVLKGLNLSAFFVAGTPDEKFGSKLTLFIESTIPLNTETILEKIKASALYPYYVPRKIIVLQHFERTPTGKVKRAEITKASGF
jgi:o-succinylbenzoate---CoA ligase